MSTEGGTPAPDGAAIDPSAPTGRADPVEATVAATRRLHPMSWLFVLLAQLKQFVVPLIAIVVFGQRGDDRELWSLIAVGVFVVIPVWQYFTYRYGVAGDRLVVRSGLLERSLRVIPFGRIHNVALQQTLLHRLFGVAEVRLESAGGTRPEAEMRVLRLDEALALEALVRRQAARAAVDGEPRDEPAATPLLSMSFGEVVRLGLISNRGMIVVGAAFASLSQFNDRLLADAIEGAVRGVAGRVDAASLGPVDYAVGVAALVAVALVAVRALSVVLALLQYHGFTLTESDRRLTVERGLLARWRTSAARRRIQAWTLREGVLHRLFGRRSLAVDTAVMESVNGQRALRELAPVGTPSQCDGLIEHLLPQARWSSLRWTPLPVRHWWRLWLPVVPWVVLAALAVAWRFGPWGLLVLLWLPWAAYAAWRAQRASAWTLNDAIVGVRAGWWSRHWRFAEIDRVQALRLSRSPLDRACGTATLSLDTAGAAPTASTPPLRIRFLPDDEARALHSRLAAELRTRPMRW